jgi:lysine 2,3-aminomutase
MTENNANEFSWRIKMTWQEQIANSYNKIEELPDFKYSSKELKRLQKIIQRHPMRITPYYYSLIDQNDIEDPIAKMVIPDLRELEKGGTYDTSGEANNTVFDGVQHKYESTVLLLSNHRCAAYCRHCFRKRLVGLSESEILKRVDEAISYIKLHKTINNILITGGDPLMLETKVIGELLDKVTSIEQLDFVRIGSRIPVTLPQRIIEDTRLQEMLGYYNNNRKRLYLVTHYNHPREMSSESIAALKALGKLGIIVSNQGVLLKGVNDSVEIMVKLLRKLVKNGVMPYYVFQCRPVKGIKRMFQVPLVRGIAIMEEVREQLDGISKRFRFIMSTRQGKMEILGRYKNEILIKMHQAKDAQQINAIYRLQVNDWGCWINEFRRLK